MKYKTELHCHSKDASACSSESAEGIVEKYLKYGYTTVCLTNHFHPATVNNTNENWHACIEYHYAAYEKLVRAAGDRLNIIMGLEFRMAKFYNDYLVFGFDREYLETRRETMNVSTIGTFIGQARADGLFTIIAHPFRLDMSMIKPDFVDAVEVYNGHPGHNSNNDMAAMWAKKYGKTMTAGTDHHDPQHMPDGGIITDEPILSSKQLVEVLRSGKFDLIRDQR